MDKGWEVSEDQYMEHLMTNTLMNQISEQQYIQQQVHDTKMTISTQTFLEQSPKGRNKMRFRTSSMPKLLDDNPNSSLMGRTMPVVSPKRASKLEERTQETSDTVAVIPSTKSPIRSPIKTPVRLPMKYQTLSKTYSQQRMSLKATLFQNPLQEEVAKVGRTLQPKQFNPPSTGKSGNESHFPGMKGQTRSVKSASMSNIFNDERINFRRKIEDFVFKLRPQRNANIIYMNLANRGENINVDDFLFRRFHKH